MSAAFFLNDQCSTFSRRTHFIIFTIGFLPFNVFYVLPFIETTTITWKASIRKKEKAINNSLSLDAPKKLENYWIVGLPVLSSSLAYFGVLHMLHSDLLAQLTFPHLYEDRRKIKTVKTEHCLNWLKYIHFSQEFHPFWNIFVFTPHSGLTKKFSYCLKTRTFCIANHLHWRGLCSSQPEFSRSLCLQLSSSLPLWFSLWKQNNGI